MEGNRPRKRQGDSTNLPRCGYGFYYGRHGGRDGDQGGTGGGRDCAGQGVFDLGVATLLFAFEGKKRMQQAKKPLWSWVRMSIG